MTTISLVGNPNCGKTTIFNSLTGKSQKVGNWPGVTVDKKTGIRKFNDKDYNIVDLPGIYSIDGSSTKSIDEKIAGNFILSEKNNIVINIIDASNLEKNLFLTTELLDMNVPMILVLNMGDIAEARKVKIDIDRLSKRLGVAVIKMIANKSIGKKELLSAIEELSITRKNPIANVSFGDNIDNAINLISSKINSSRWEALEYLRSNSILNEKKGGKFNTEDISQIKKASGGKLDFTVINTRHNFIKTITTSISRKPEGVTITLSDKVDKLIMNRWASLPIFLLTIYTMFLVAINIGGAFIDFFDMASGTIFVDGFGNVLRFIKMPEFIVIILANGIGGGIQTVATFIPIVFFLYLFLTLLESTGYMVRVAFITERFMRWAGLPGKSFMSLSVGFGCSVPAIMSTRTIESLKHRIIVILMLPFMSCGAKLPVYVLFAAAFFPHNGQNIIFLLYLIGISLAVITGFIMRKAVLKTEAGNMLLDLPPYHVPNIKNILINSWNKVKIFIFGAGKILVPLVMVLVVLNSIGTNGTFKANNKNSLLAEIGKTIVPVFKPIGITDNNWQATVGIFTGMLAKEALIGTLDALYGADGKNDDEEFDLLQNIIDAFKTIPENLFSLKFSDPVGIAVGDLSNIEEVAADQEVQISTFKSMHNKFDGKIGAFAYLLFILLYAPCSAALSAAFKEIGTKWTLFMALWSTALAYSVSVIFYQTATFFSHPTYSSISIILSIAMMVGIVLYMSRKNSISEMIPLNKSSGCYS